MNSTATARALLALEASQTLPRPPASAAPLRILVVADDVALRLNLADRLLAHCHGGQIDTATARDAVGLGPRLRDYAAAVVIVELAAPRAVGTAGPVAIVAELRTVARGLAVTVVGRGGDERSAVEALRAGAVDYWPLHTVNFRELVATLRTQVAPRGPAGAADPPPVIPGFRPIKPLSRSARAALYLADCDEVGEPIVLKVHRHGLADPPSDTERERFHRECRVLSGLNHRAVADVYGFGITDECHWLAMEYFPAGSLRARMQHPLRTDEVVAYVRQIAEGLAVVHAAGVVHRDLKPSNVMLRADNTVALIDFGLARPVLRNSSVTGRNERVGSPSYMAPEQIEGLPPDQRCDLYSLGVLFHELLTGQLPFAGETVPEVLAQHLRARPPRLPAPVAVYQKLVDDLLAKRPPDRPASVQDFLDALASASAPRPERR